MKVDNILTHNNSPQRCSKCHKKQSEFKKKNVSFDMLQDVIQFGISTLHFGINSVKAILKIASQIEIKTHRCYGTDQDVRDERAERNAKLLWEELNIKVEDWFNVDGMKNPITLKYNYLLPILKF